MRLIRNNQKLHLLFLIFMFTSLMESGRTFLLAAKPEDTITYNYITHLLPMSHLQLRSFISFCHIFEICIVGVQQLANTKLNWQARVYEQLWKHISLCHTFELLTFLLTEKCFFYCTTIQITNINDISHKKLQKNIAFVY